MKQDYILVLGSNIGNRLENIRTAMELVASASVSILANVPPFSTSPILVHDQPMFMNAGVLVQTDLDPLPLMQITQDIESRMGRKKRFRYGPREIDIDIVWWSKGLFTSQDLSIPHPENSARFWVRKILSTLAPEKTDPVTGILYRDVSRMSIQKITDFEKKKKTGEKISMLTVYDYSMARLLAQTSVDTILVGDSLGNVIQGNTDTLSVSLDDMVYHGRSVRRAIPDKFITIDMPFLTYQVSNEEAIRNAGLLLSKTGADAVKLEGAGRFVKTINLLTETGIPVMGHLGLTPQSVHQLGGYRIQGKTIEARSRIISDAKEIEDAGAFALVLEMVPAELAKEVAQSLSIPVIGIGAGPDTDGQVLVFHDYLGLIRDFRPSFARAYDHLAERIHIATEKYCEDVRTGHFPSKDEYH